MIVFFLDSGLIAQLEHSDVWLRLFPGALEPYVIRLIESLTFSPILIDVTLEESIIVVEEPAEPLGLTLIELPLKVLPVREVNFPKAIGFLIDPFPLVDKSSGGLLHRHEGLRLWMVVRVDLGLG